MALAGPPLKVLVDSVRQRIDQIIYSGDRADVEADLISERASAFSDFGIVERLTRAAMFIGARVKYEHVPNLKKSLNQGAGVLDKDIYRIVDPTIALTEGESITYVKRKTLSELRNIEKFFTESDNQLY